MTPERETELMDLKDRLLDAIHQVDELLCGGVVPLADQDDDVPLDLPEGFGEDDELEEDPDDDEIVVTEVVSPSNASRKQKPIDYSGIDHRTTAYKQNHQEA